MAPPRNAEEVEEVEETAETTQETETEEVETEEAGDEPETEEETDEGDAEGDTDEDEPEEEPPPRQTRGNRQYGALRAQNRELRNRLDALERRPAAPDPAAQRQAEERERQAEEQVLLTGDPGQIAKYYADRAQRQADAKLNTVLGHVVDTSDRTTFQTLCSSNPVYASISDEVEKRLADARRQGANPQRLALAHLILGERVANRTKGAKTRQERRAATERQRQTAKPGGSRSDVPANRRRQDSHEARAKRLDDSGLM